MFSPGAGASDLPKRPSERLESSKIDLGLMGSNGDYDLSQRPGVSCNRNASDGESIAGSDAASESVASTVIDKSKASADLAERLTIGRTETRWVQILRLSTLLVLVLTAVFVAMAVYTFGNNSQKQSFTNEYEAFAVRITESFHTGIARQLAAFDTLSAGITAHAINSASAFPTVTVPHWSVIANQFQIQAQATFVHYFPWIAGNETDDSERLLWEEYAYSNHEWIKPSFFDEHLMRTAQDKHLGFESEGQMRQKDDDSDGVDLSHLAHAGGFSPYIWSPTTNEPMLPFTGPYMPSWHVAPAMPFEEILNNNGIEYSFNEGPATVVTQTGMASLGIMTPFLDPKDELSNIAKMFNATLFMGPYRHSAGDFQYDPITFFAYPVFDSFVPMGTERKVSGVLVSGLYWRVLFQDLLPPSAQGIFVVLKNSLGQTETFEISGGEASYVGQGDLHDPAYDHMVESASIVDFLTSRTSSLTQSYTAVDLTDAYTEYHMFVYPSSQTEAVYVNQEPIWYAVIIGTVFVFVTAVFLLYNYLVERRQKLVLDRAVKSSAVVHSLFPKNVQQRLYEEQDQSQQKAAGKRNAMWAENRANANDTSISNDIQAKESSVEDANHSTSSPPIADLFSESTVFFADLAGFTRWSSTRSPVEVFGLLETIYSKFDALALRRGVFKVETIGDCYVAVTGVPEAQKDHALIMAKFGAECMVALQQMLVGTLADKYGEGTRDLSLRIGLHSGPVTAGVLRGVKARFQLFGDTVNTAARMESNGMPGRIHCSQATADLLVSAGKGDWITAREGVVHAKGKGEMQTYWIDNAQNSKSASKKRQQQHTN